MIWFDELPVETYYIFVDSEDDCKGEILATSEADALEIAAAKFPEYPFSELYAIAASEF